MRPLKFVERSRGEDQTELAIARVPEKAGTSGGTSKKARTHPSQRKSRRSQGCSDPEWLPIAERSRIVSGSAVATFGNPAQESTGSLDSRGDERRAGTRFEIHLPPGLSTSRSPGPSSNPPREPGGY